MSSLPAGQSSAAARAELSLGTSGAPVYAMVTRALAEIGLRDATIADIGCGRGQLRPYIRPYTRRYVGADVLRYADLPVDVEFHQIDLDSGRAALPDAFADAAIAVETIEHLENPRAFVRELVRMVRPGGWVIVTTPNQLSALSIGSLVLKHHFNAFGDSNYPAHITALLEIDLRRIGTECSLTDIRFRYSLDGRVPFTAHHLPAVVAALNPRRLSNNVLMMGRVQGA